MKSLLILLVLGLLVSCGTEDIGSEGTGTQSTSPDPVVDQEPETVDDPDPMQDPEPTPVDDPIPEQVDTPDPERTPPADPTPAEDPEPATLPAEEPEPTPLPAEEPEPAEEPVADVPENSGSLSIQQVSLVSSAGENSSFMDVFEIDNGFELDLATISADVFNIIAEPEDEDFSGSIQFDLAGPTSISRFENTARYTLAPEPANLMTDGGLVPGIYQLLVTAYELPDLQGAVGQPLSITFSVISDEEEAERAATVPPILSIEVGTLDSATNSLGSTIPITDGTQLDLTDYLGAQINFVAVSEDASQTGSVQFSLAGPEGFVPINRIENAAPYTVERDSLNFLGSGTPLPVGGYTLTVTPYELASAAGDAGTTRVVTFNVVGVELNADIPVDEPIEVPVDGPIEDPIDDAPLPPAPPIINIVGSDDGFTPIVPSSDTRQVFVSSSLGSDANTCLTENDPCASIEQGIERMREGFPDHLLLRRGDTWRVVPRAMDGIPSGRSTEEPVVISYYGESGERPIIESNGQVYRQDRRLVSHVRWIGLHFYGYTHDPDHPEFNPDSGTPDLRFVPEFNDILVEDSVFEFAEVTVQAINSQRPSNFTFRRNIFNGSYANNSSFSRSGRRSNVFTFGADGLNMEENVFDFGGWYPDIPGAGANQLSHCVYHQFSSDGNRTFFVNNIVSRCASHGIQMRSGGLAEDNFFARNSLGMLMGYNVVPVPENTIAHVFNNVFSEGKHMSSKGIDACEGQATCSGALWGLDVAANSDADYQAFGNIVSMLAPGEEDRTGIVDGNSRNLTVSSLRIFNAPRREFPNGDNLTYRFESETEGTDRGYVDPERTLATYNRSLGGNESYDEFMETVTSRPLGTWDVRYTAREINAYIRAGFEIEN